MDKEATFYIGDTHGFLGSAISQQLANDGFSNILAGPDTVSRLKNPGAVDCFFSRARPQYVFLVGGPSGGIRANQRFPAELMLDNMLINCNIIDSAHRYGARKLLYLASSCVYPKFSQQPMRVESLMTGKLEPTNEAYALAKLAGVYLCRAYRRQFNAHFIEAIPANVFGPGDDFSLEDSHVVGALMRRMHDAKVLGQDQVVIWGTGLPRREFIYSHDVAAACLFIMRHYHGAEPINLGVGFDFSIRELAEMIRNVVGYSGELKFDEAQPDGMPAKLLDSSLLAEIGWKPQTSIQDGLKATYQWFLQQKAGVSEA